MNDLISKSFSSGKGAGHSDHVIEMGAAPTVNLDKFFEDVELVKEDLMELENLKNELHQANNRSKTLHSAKAIRELRASMDANVAASLRKAKIIKVRLEALDRANASNRSIPGCGPGSSSDRTRTSVVNGLRKKLKDSMDSFNELRSSISSEYRETVERRIYTVTGETPDEKTLDRLISTGESESILQKAIQEQGRGSIMDMVNEIQERHSAVKDLEKNLRDLHQVFLDMAVLVEEQGGQLDEIEINMQRANSYVRGGVDTLQSAKVYQRNTRKWTISAILILIIIIIVIVLLIVKPWKK